MAFVNERIPEADFKKYDFARLNKRLRKCGGASSQCTIDRESDIWLRNFYVESDHTAPDGGFTGVSMWDFYWKGTLMMAEIKAIASGGGRGSPRWARKRLLNITIPSELESRRHEILQSLEVAFTAYRGAGIFSTDTEFDYTFYLEV